MVMALQLLPVKQAVRYFFIDNLIIEEILHVNKNATKNFRLIDEDHNNISDFHQYTPKFYLISDIAFFQDAEMLPIYYSSEIPTPPPNFAPQIS